MWEQDTPDVDDLLRQGDLLTGLPFPRRGTLELTVNEMRASVYPSRTAVVLDQCCTVEQKYTVLLGRVGDVRRLPDEHPLMEALRTDQPAEGVKYSKYLHLLDPIEEVLPDLQRKLWVVEMTERVSIGTKTIEDLRWLHDHRVARMTPLARARLRARLLVHFTTVAAEDRTQLSTTGHDELGRDVGVG